MCSKALQFSRYEVASYDAACTSINDDNVKHFIARIKFYGSCVYLAHKCGVSTEQQLLARLSFCVERTTYLHTTERAVSQQAAVLTCKGNALRNALIDDACADFSEAIYVCFASTIVATLHRIIEKTIYRVTVVLVVLSCIDTALSCDRVRAAR